MQMIAALNTVKSLPQLKSKDYIYTKIVFQLFTKYTFYFCIFASILVKSSQYLDSPIKCEQWSTEETNISRDTFQLYCWNHGYNRTLNVNGTKSEENNDNDCPDQSYDHVSYYGWVHYVLLFNAVLFKLPHYIWKNLEKGRMKKISSLKDEEDKKNVDDYVEEYFNEFKKITPNEKFWYYTNFQICQGLNVLILFINFWISNYFLDGDFFHYGPNWLYYWFSIGAANPMTCIFPDTAYCAMEYMMHGSLKMVQGICILPENSMTEKIYLVLWFWFVFLFGIGVLQTFLELAIFAMPNFRLTFMELNGSFPYENTEEVDGLMHQKKNRDFIRDGNKCDISDWFLLYQIRKNTSEDIYSALVEKISQEQVIPASASGQSSPSPPIPENTPNRQENIEMTDV